MSYYVFRDLETFCETPISVGTHKYAENVEIMLDIYKIGDAPVRCWDRTADPEPPQDLVDACSDPEAIFVYHGAAFDANILERDPLTPHVPLSRTICTMAQALAHGLPGSLDKLCAILKIDDDQAKDKDGKALIQLFCKPQPKNRVLRRATRYTHPAEWERFKHYGCQDVVATAAIFTKLPKFNYPYLPAERRMWELDQRINRRGVLIDDELCTTAIISAARVKAEINDRTKDLTFEAVGAPTQRDAMMRYLAEAYDLKLPDLKTSTIEELLDDDWIDLPDAVRELLTLRLRGARNSTAKYRKMQQCKSSDGRLRGVFTYCGASRTGRWAAKLAQLHNMARVPKYLKKEYDQAIDTIKADAVDLIYDDPMDVLGSVVRGALIAPPGKKLDIADWSNIEGRVLAWAAGEEWKVRAFAEFDAMQDPKEKENRDIYRLAYARSFNVPVETADADQRQMGKILELALGYAGGVGAFITFATTYGVDLEKMAQAALPTLPQWAIDEAKSLWRWAVEQDRTYGLSELVYVVCDALKRLWRRAHPATVQWWDDMMDAAIGAIRQPDRDFRAGPVIFRRERAWLRMILPSGRSVCYPSPFVDEDGKGFKFMGVNQFNKKWSRLHAWRGIPVENCIQAIARDILRDGLLRVEDELMFDEDCYIAIHVHDEIAAEVPENSDWTQERLADVMTVVPPWAQGLPLAAEGFECKAYRK